MIRWQGMGIALAETVAGYATQGHVRLISVDAAAQAGNTVVVEKDIL
jgi:hypothetical protein